MIYKESFMLIDISQFHNLVQTYQRGLQYHDDTERNTDRGALNRQRTMFPCLLKRGNIFNRFHPEARRSDDLCD